MPPYRVIIVLLQDIITKRLIFGNLYFPALSKDTTGVGLLGWGTLLRPAYSLVRLRFKPGIGQVLFLNLADVLIKLVWNI
jgi:hypothetical protein